MGSTTGTSDGDALRELVIGSKAWVHRKVQRYDYSTPGTVRVQATLDLTLQSLEVIHGSQQNALIPISLVTKGTLRSFDIRTAGNQPMAVLEAAQTTEMVRAMMRSILTVANLKLLAAADDTDEFSFIECMPNNADSSVQTFRDRIPLRDASPQNLELVMKVVKQLSRTRLLIVEVPKILIGQRTVVSYSYDLELVKGSGFRSDSSFTHQIEIEDPGFPASLHQEIVMPPELEICSLFLEFRQENRKYLRATVSGGDPQRVAHIYTRDVPRFSKASLEFDVRPVASGLFNFTKYALAVVFLVTVFMVGVRFGPDDLFLQPEWISSTSAAVVLAGPAILLSWVARTPEHDIVAHALSQLRLINVLLAGSLFVTAVALSTAWQPIAWNVLWLLSYSLVFIAFVVSLRPLFNR